jgi:hypothetical protein
MAIYGSVGEIIDESKKRFLAADEKNGGLHLIDLAVPGLKPREELIYVEETPGFTVVRVLEDAGIAYEDPNFISLMKIVVAGLERAIDTEAFVSKRRERARTLNNLPAVRALRNVEPQTLDPKE